MKVRYAPRARSDLEEIIRYIASDNPYAAERVRDAILDTIELISAYPHAGIKNAVTPEVRSRLVRRYPYRVHYRLRDGELVIIHVRHAARRPWTGEK
jgi:plasmid stabilization system protein ParE